MRRIIPPGDAPPWISQFIEDIIKAIEQPAEAPVRLKSYADAAALPPAGSWTFGVVHVADIDELAFSDGTNWFPLTKGAAL